MQATALTLINIIFRCCLQSILNVVLRVHLNSFKRLSLDTFSNWFLGCIYYFLHFLIGKFITGAVLLYLVNFRVVYDQIDLESTQDRKLIALLHEISSSSAFGIFLLVEVFNLLYLSISPLHVYCVIIYFICVKKYWVKYYNTSWTLLNSKIRKKKRSCFYLIVKFPILLVSKAF